MQRSYFLGGSGPDGFETAFWDENKTGYGFLLKGGPGTGKSTLMKKVAAAFSGEQVSVYHCASDPQSLDAVVLEERGVYVADATAPHERDVSLPFVSGELVNLADCVAPDKLNHTDTLRYYGENRRLHTLARKGIAGAAALNELTESIGQNALLTEKLDGFAERFAKKLLPKKGRGEGLIRKRQLIALTPAGRLTLCPEGWKLVLLYDPFYAASHRLLRLISDYAAENGHICEVSCSITQHERPVSGLLLPEAECAVLSVQSKKPEMLPESAQTVSTERFYDRGKLREQRTLSRFCVKSASAVSEQTVSLLAEALHIHDLLEKNYIAAMNPQKLNERTAAVITEIMKFPRRSLL